MGTALSNITAGLNEIERISIVLFNPGSNGKNIGVKDNILR